MLLPVPAWRDVDCRRSQSLQWDQRAFHLKQQQRCRDPEFQVFQEEVRWSTPSRASIQALLGRCILARTLEWGILADLWAEDPDAMVLCARRTTANEVNSLAVAMDPAELLAEILLLYTALVAFIKKPTLNPNP